MLKLCLPNIGLLALIWSSGAWAKEPEKERDAKPLTFQAPKGWKTLEGNMFTFARFEAGKGDQLATVTVVALGGDGGGLPANINRWRSQVGLEKLDEKVALGQLKPLQVDGIDGHLLDLSGDDAITKAKSRIRVAIVKHKDETWFIRMSGPSGVVGDQVSAFDEFIKSVRFRK